MFPVGCPSCTPNPQCLHWTQTNLTLFSSITGRKLWSCHILDLCPLVGNLPLSLNFWVAKLSGCLSPACAALLDAGKANREPAPTNRSEILSTVPLYHLISLIHSLLKGKKKHHHHKTQLKSIFNTSSNIALRSQGRGSGRGREVCEATQGGLLLTPPSLDKRALPNPEPKPAI